MSNFLDIFIVPKGIYITFLKFFQIGGVLMKTNTMLESGIMHKTKSIDIVFTIWKFGIHIHPVISERNLCQDVILAKS